MNIAPVQLLDNFLLDYHPGHALVLLFALSVVGSLPLKSRKVISLNTMAFGALFLLTPNSMLGETPFVYKFAGVVLLIVGPMLYVTARK